MRNYNEIWESVELLLKKCELVLIHKKNEKPGESKVCFDSLYELKIQSEDTFKTLKDQLENEGLEIIEICPNCGEETGWHQECEPWAMWKSGLCDECREQEEQENE